MLGPGGTRSSGLSRGDWGHNWRGQLQTFALMEAADWQQCVSSLRVSDLLNTHTPMNDLEHTSKHV